jgi:hypothetical protein
MQQPPLKSLIQGLISLSKVATAKGVLRFAWPCWFKNVKHIIVSHEIA